MKTAAGARILSDDRSGAYSKSFPVRLGLKDVEPVILGRAYEYLLRKFGSKVRDRVPVSFTHPARWLF
jgi:hypothetical protein